LKFCFSNIKMKKAPNRARIRNREEAANRTHQQAQAQNIDRCTSQPN